MRYFMGPGAGNRLKAAGCLAVLSLSPFSAFAIDFKIDLPPQKGVSTPDDANFFDDVLSVSEGQSNSIMGSDENLNAAIPSPIPPASANVPAAQQKSFPSTKETRGRSGVANQSDKKSFAADMSQFPNPSCLSENIAFWKRVYAEVDNQEALIHDRDDLEKIYATVRLGGSEPQRQQSMRMLKEHYRQSLRSLSEKIDSPKNWNPTERSIAKFFRPSELTRSHLLQASENIRIQQGLKSRFNSGVQKSLQYLPTIKNIVKAQGLPLDIAFLPHVESSFVNHAKSKVGAVGLWQLMPQTMQLLLGRKAVNKRTDPQTATLAATKLLKQNFDATGSWPLALTAYNHGLAGVLRAVRSTGSTDLCKIIERYNSPSFRFASSNFYAQFLAARQIALQRYTDLSKNREVGRIVAPLLASRDKGAL
ncbi:lytic transglycosylase domain-containing protein [bacterium]|nr:lytic transglycosylase domain-containing protein [bacterium]